MCWLQVKLKAALFSQRNMAKEIDEHNYRTLLNYAVLKNRKKKNVFYKNVFIDCRNYSEKVWNRVMGLLDTSISTCPSSVDVDWRTITKLADIANHFADIFTKKMNL